MGLQGTLVMVQLTLSGINLVIIMWYLTPPYPDMASKPVAHYDFVSVNPVTPYVIHIEPMTTMTKPPPFVAKPNNGGIRNPNLQSPIATDSLPELPLKFTRLNVGGINQPRLKSLVMTNTTPTIKVTPPCTLCGKQGHVTNLCPTLLELGNFLNTHISVMHATHTTIGVTPSTSSSPNMTTKSNSLCTNHVHLI